MSHGNAMPQATPDAKSARHAWIDGALAGFFTLAGVQLLASRS